MSAGSAIFCSGSNRLPARDAARTPVGTRLAFSCPESGAPAPVPGAGGRFPLRLGTRGSLRRHWHSPGTDSARTAAVSPSTSLPPPAVRRCAGQRLSRPAEPRFTRAREPALAGGCRRALGSGWAGAGARHARRAAVSRCARRHGAGHGLGRAGAAVRRLAAHRGGLARPVLPVRGPAGAAAARGGGGGGRGAGAARRASRPAVAAGAVAAGLGASPQQPGAPARGTAGRGRGRGGRRPLVRAPAELSAAELGRRVPAGARGTGGSLRAALRCEGAQRRVSGFGERGSEPETGAMEPADVAAWTFPQQPLFPLILWHDSGIDL